MGQCWTARQIFLASLPQRDRTHKNRNPMLKITTKGKTSRQSMQQVVNARRFNASGRAIRRDSMIPTEKVGQLKGRGAWKNGGLKPSSGQASARTEPVVSRSLRQRIKFSHLVFGADCAKERELILVKLARWMASSCHFLHPPLPFTFQLSLWGSCYRA